MRRLIALLLLLAASAPAARTTIPVVSKDPYVGAIVVDAETGNVLFADRADDRGYPASMLKLMDLLIILEQVEQGRLRYTDPIQVTAEASRIGGSQVFLKEHEVFPLEEMLYALMVQSANDAAAAIAIHIAGSKDGFIALMNQRAAALGMTSTRFNSVHGLPPSDDAQPDVTTARDFALLCRELLKHPDALKFTATVKRPFRPAAPQPFIMENHNDLLGSFQGCDGLKTGFIRAGGYSIAATAQRNGRRVICIVLGSREKQVRDTRAASLMTRGFLVLPPPPPPPPPAPAVTNLPPPTPEPAPEPEQGGVPAWVVVVAALLGAGVAGGAAWYFLARPKGGDVVKRRPM